MSKTDCKSCIGFIAAILIVACLCSVVASAPESRLAYATTDAKKKEVTSKPAEQPAKPLTKAALEKLLTKLEKELGNIQTLWTEFEQEKHLSVFSEIIKAEGVCLFRSPDHVRFEITKPFHSVMIAKGKSVAKFEMLNSQWRKLKLGNTEMMLRVNGQIASWLQGKFRQRDDIYEISATVSQHTMLILTPRKKRFREYISSIELKLSDDQKRVVSVTIREPKGDFTVMRFTHEQRDAPLPDNLFDTKGTAPTALPIRKDSPITRPAGDRSKTPTSRPSASADGKIEDKSSSRRLAV